MKRTNNFFSRRSANIDITHRCALECPNCRRQYEFRNKGLSVPGEDMPAETFEKISNFFTSSIDFEGQSSDPVHHPRFIDYLEICYEKNIRAEIHNASSVKSKDWYIRAFIANPEAEWVFSIDGLPKDSAKYRINQDGEKLYNIMIESKKYLNKLPTWQYIVFAYNENDVETAIDMAAQDEVKFYLLQSSRWQGEEDPLIPKNEQYRMTAK